MTTMPPMQCAIAGIGVTDFSRYGGPVETLGRDIFLDE